MLPALISDHGLSFIKLRIAHSLTGNASALGNGSQYIAGGAYVINPTLSLASGFPYNGIGGFLLNTTIANPNIKPEAVTENEVGLELGFLRNRFMLTAVAYRSELKDGIVSAKIPSSSGFTAALLNAAHTQNQGLEFELKASLIRKKELSWNLNINYTHNESKVLSINGDLPSIGINGPNANAYAVVGYSYPVIQSRDWKRDPDGHVIVDPISGNPSLDPTLKVLGQASPKDILGISTSLSWKNFSFSATADYRGGHKIFNSLGQQSDFTGISTTSAITGRQRFVFPNSVVDAGGGKYVPNTNVTVDDANFNFWPGLYRSAGANYVISAAAWKLREVSISYDIPHKVYAATKIISRAAFSISGRNLLMFRPKTNVWTDPEFNEDTGNDIGRTSTSQSPPTRIISGTLTLSF
jgi:outer membrane receptor protein involved in Fe transport